MSGKNIMLCVVLDDREECSIDVSVMCLQLPFMRQYESFHVNFVKSYQEATLSFEKTNSYDTLVVINSHKANTNFVLNAIDTKHNFIVGMSILPQINWSLYENDKPCSEYDIPRAHLDKIDRLGYSKLLINPYDMKYKFPECFVMKRVFNPEVDHIMVDVRNVFKGTCKTEFIGCIKLRYAKPQEAHNVHIYKNM
jgi:hypothetical protein